MLYRVMAWLLLLSFSLTASAVNPRYFELLELVRTGTEKSPTEISQIRELSQYAFSETLQMLYLRYEEELKRVEKDDVRSAEILMTLLECMQNLVSQYDIKELMELVQLTDYSLREHPLRIKIEPEVRILMEYAVENTTKLKSVISAEKNARNEFESVAVAPGKYLLVPKNTASHLMTERLQAMEQYLTDHIIGQPEVIDKMMNLLYRNQYIDQSDKPSILVLMGQPGTGKDTSAEAFVDAIHGKEGAHEKHLYRLNVMRQESDVTAELGSSTGYIGSDNFPRLLDFIVKHSGGRYVIEVKENNGKKNIVVNENPEWHPGITLPNTFSPEEGVIYVNEFHDWSMEMKNFVLKEAFEKGLFRIPNSNGAESKIYVPIKFIIATNEGAELVSPNGKPLNYTKMLSLWKKAHNDIPLLRKQFIKPNSLALYSNGRTPGTSKEILNRFPDSSILLMRPLSPEDLQKIIEMHLQKLSRKLAKGKGGYGEIKLEWTEKLVTYLQEYQYSAEANARPMSDRVTNLVENTLVDLFRNKQIDVKAPQLIFSLDVLPNSDRTADLQILIKDSNNTAHVLQELRLPIRATEAERLKLPITDERINELLEIPKKLMNKVFGIERIVDRLGAAVLNAEEASTGKAHSEHSTVPATTFMFLGPSSNGKTRTGKIIAEALDIETITIDFSQVQSMEDFKSRLLGTRDSLGNHHASDFMKAYDRSNGRILVVLDEIANAPLPILKGAYDILREPVVSTFSDGEPRVMSQVIFIATGNAGEKWFQAIPTGLPDITRQAAMQDIHKMMMQDPERRRKMLEEFFSPALINRIGMSNIFFFSPLNYKSIRQLFQLKTMEAIENLKPEESRRGWNVYFRDQQTFIQLMEQFEHQGYILDEQGASIDRFVHQDFERLLRQLLIKMEIPSGENVILDFDPKTGISTDPYSSEAQILNISVTAVPSESTRTSGSSGASGSSPKLMLHLRGREHKPHPKGFDEDKVFTAIHEAGHEIVRQFYFGEAQPHELITIVDGVTEIARQIIHYAGLAKSGHEKEFKPTKEYVLREVAVLYAGDLAQSLLKARGGSNGGKSNDMERATQIIFNSILRMGLSPQWGDVTAPSQMTNEAFIQTLSEDKKKVLFAEVDRWMNEGKQLALDAILPNLDASLIPLSMTLAQMGTMEKKDLDQFYRDHTVYVEGSKETKQWWRKWTGTALKVRWNRLLNRPGTLVPQILNGISWPENIVNIDLIRQKEKDSQIAEVELPPDLPVYTDIDPNTHQKKTELLMLPASHPEMSCRDVINL